MCVLSKHMEHVRLRRAFFDWNRDTDKEIIEADSGYTYSLT